VRGSLTLSYFLGFFQFRGPHLASAGGKEQPASSISSARIFNQPFSCCLSDGDRLEVVISGRKGCWSCPVSLEHSVFMRRLGKTPVGSARRGLLAGRMLWSNTWTILRGFNAE